MGKNSTIKTKNFNQIKNLIRLSNLETLKDDERFEDPVAIIETPRDREEICNFF